MRIKIELIQRLQEHDANCVWARKNETADVAESEPMTEVSLL